jgi:hypothetical protein
MKRLYVLVNKRLSPVYGCVQAGHAVAQWLLDNPDQTWNNNFLIYLYADTDKWMEMLEERGIKYSAFKEPDLNGTVTAIALEENTGLMFQTLKPVE